MHRLLLAFVLFPSVAHAFGVWDSGCASTNPCLTYTCAPGYRCFNTGAGERECFDPNTGTYSEIQSLVHAIGSGSAGASVDGVGTMATLTRPMGMVAVHGTARDFLFTEVSGGLVRYVRGITGEVITVIGSATASSWFGAVDGVGTAGAMYYAGGMAYSTVTGLYYAADTDRVRWIQLSGGGDGTGPATVGTLAGGGDAFDFPFVDGPVNVATMAFPSWASPVLGSLVVHDDGLRLFAVEGEYGSVCEVSLTTGEVTTRKGTFPTVMSPTNANICVLGMRFGGGGAAVGDTLYTSSVGGAGAVCALDLATNTMTLISGKVPPTTSTQNGTTSFTSPAIRTMLPMPDGSILVGDGHTLRKWDKGPANMPVLTLNDVPHTTSACTPVFGRLSQSRTCHISGLVRTGDGTIFIALRVAEIIARIDSVRE